MSPKELKKGECEEDFTEAEVHICDGIDMGCQENEAKGFVDRELFHVEKVQGKKLICVVYFVTASKGSVI